MSSSDGEFGLYFALRADLEHRNLRIGENSQITICSELDGTQYLQYKEDVSKTNRGGLQHKHLTQKITRAYQNKMIPERCPVLEFEKYLSLRPANGKCDALYLRPLKYSTSSSWYADAAVGVHILQKSVAKLCEKAGFKGHFTNHYLRATAATRLYDAGVDEQLITEKSGHRSSAVRPYKRTQDAQLVKISEIIQGSEMWRCF